MTSRKGESIGSGERKSTLSGELALAESIDLI